MKYCYECGAKVGEKDKRCPACGIKLKRVDEKMRVSTKIIIALLSVMVIPVILCCAIVVSYVFMTDGQSGLKLSLEKQNMAAVNATATAEPDASPFPSPSVSPSASPQAKLLEGYSVYTDNEYNFSCAYPNGFKEYNDNTAAGRYTLKSPDGSGILKICASKNSASVTAEQSLSVYKSKCGGYAQKEEQGNDYYEVLLKNDDSYFYKYLRLENGNMYWFEFEYDKKDKSVYDEYIKYIYNSFTINRR